MSVLLKTLEQYKCDSIKGTGGVGQWLRDGKQWETRNEATGEDRQTEGLAVWMTKDYKEKKYRLIKWPQYPNLRIWFLFMCQDNLWSYLWPSFYCLFFTFLPWWGMKSIEPTFLCHLYRCMDLPPLSWDGRPYSSLCSLFLSWHYSLSHLTDPLCSSSYYLF